MSLSGPFWFIIIYRRRPSIYHLPHDPILRTDTTTELLAEKKIAFIFPNNPSHIHLPEMEEISLQDN